MSEAAERGKCPEAKPNREGLKGRRACKKQQSRSFFDTTLAILLLLPDAHHDLLASPNARRLERMMAR